MVFTVILNMALFSCTPQSIADENLSPQACCGDDGEITPPPPPPPPNGGS